MMKFNLTKQIITAALVASVGFFGCQKSEMDEVDTLMASNTQNLIQSGLELKFGTPGTTDLDPYVEINPVLAGSEIHVSARRIDGGGGNGTMTMSEYRVNGKPADHELGGGDWITLETTPAQNPNTLRHYIWTPTIENIGLVSYKVNYSGGTNVSNSYNLTVINKLQIVNPCTEGEISFNSPGITVGDDVNGIRSMYASYNLNFCLQDARRVVVRALLLQPEEVELADGDDLGLVSNQGKNQVVTWSQDATSGSYNFGVSFSKKFKGNGSHKLTGVWNAKIYNAAGEMIAEMNSPNHAEFQ